MSFGDNRPPYFEQRWQTFKNIGTQAIPAHSLVEVSTSGQSPKGKVFVSVKRPASDSPKEVAVTGDLEIQPGKTGPGTFDFPAYVAYSGNAPSLLSDVGPEKDKFTVKSSKTGFITIGPGTVNQHGTSVIYVNPRTQPGGGELLWYRVASTTPEGQDNRLDPGRSAHAYLQEWDSDNEIYKTPAGVTTDDLTEIYDIADKTASSQIPGSTQRWQGHNFVLPDELVPCMQSTKSGRLEVVGSRGLWREGVVKETSGTPPGIAFSAIANNSGKVTLYVDGSLTAFPAQDVDDSFWDHVGSGLIATDTKVEIMFLPDRGVWKIIARNCSASPVGV